MSVLDPGVRLESIRELLAVASTPSFQRWSMTQAQLGKVWLVVSAFLLYYSLNSWVVSQGGNEVLGAKLVVPNKVPAAMIAIPICAILLTLTSLIGVVFALRGGSRWYDRIPIVGFDAIEAASQEGKIYQGAMIAIFSLLPLASIVYFWTRFLSAKVMLNDGSKILIGVWDSSKVTTWNDPARICTDFNKDLSDPCLGNATVLPGFEPAFFVVLTVMTVVALVWHWHVVTRRAH